MPRVVIAGLSGDSGKTLLSLGLIKTWRRNGFQVTPFKKGPDFIDAAWLSIAAETNTYNLDTFLMSDEGTLNSFLSHVGQVSVIEGNRGLFDGFDASGTHSTAQLAKLLKAPVIIIFDATKVTRTSAALIKGCQVLDKDLNIAGVVPNRVAGDRHFKIIKDSIERECGVPILGKIPKIKNPAILPERHLGLITPSEHERREKVISEIENLISDNVDTDRILDIARTVPQLEKRYIRTGDVSPIVNIGYMKDSAFSFYYPENLCALENCGAKLIPISSLEDNNLPQDLHGLYIGGGFPETHAKELCLNSGLMASIKAAAEEGLPIYAECGGLIYLSRFFEYQGQRFSFCGILPISVSLHSRPQGHGYMHLVVDTENPFYPLSYEIRAHEFHYSRIDYIDESNLKTIFKVERGTGAINGRDGLLYKNVFASYAHIHSIGNPQWARGFVSLCKKFKKKLILNLKSEAA